MSKKVLAVLTIAILVLAGVYASAHTVEVQVSPFSYQKILYRNTMQYDSQYGFGIRVGYSYNYDPNLYVGADLSYSNFKYAEKQNRYLIIDLMAKTGFVLDFGSAFKTDFAIKAGVDLRKWGSNAKFYPTAALYVGGMYTINEKIDVTLGAELKVAGQQNINPVYNSVDIGALSYLGVRVSL